MDIIEILKNDHRCIVDMLDQLKYTHGDESRMRLFDELKTALDEHAEGEVAFIYDPLAQHSAECMSLIEIAEDEHEQVEQLIDEMDELVISDERWQERLCDLERVLLEHFGMEEATILEHFTMLFDGAARERLGNAFTNAMAGGPKRSTDTDLHL